MTGHTDILSSASEQLAQIDSQTLKINTYKPLQITRMIQRRSTVCNNDTTSANDVADTETFLYTITSTQHALIS